MCMFSCLWRAFLSLRVGLVLRAVSWFGPICWPCFELRLLTTHRTSNISYPLFSSYQGSAHLPSCIFACLCLSLPIFFSCWMFYVVEFYFTMLSDVLLLSFLLRCFAMLQWTAADLFVGHTTWDEYIELTRLWKHYAFGFHGPHVQCTPSSSSSSAAPAGFMREFSFSGYPGVIASTDDFYILDSYAWLPT